MDARRSRQDAVNEKKRALILDAARRVFEADGLEAASMRAIGVQAGYTAAAIYFHFANKEAIYAELLSQSIDRLRNAVDDAVAGARTPATRLSAAALAFFDFYVDNPRELDLGFYLFRGGMRPRGLSRDLDNALNAKLARCLAPIGAAARALGATERRAQAITADAFGHAVGLLLLEHTGRIRMFGTPSRKLMESYIAGVIAAP